MFTPANLCILGAVVIVFGFFVWLNVFHTAKISRRIRLFQCAELLRLPEGSTGAPAIFAEAIHISDYYGIPLSDIGYETVADFHGEAIRSLKRAIDRLDAQYEEILMARAGKAPADNAERASLNRTISTLNDQLISLRVDLMKLRQRNWSHNRIPEHLQGKFATI